MGLHDRKTIDRHANLLADYAQMIGASMCYKNCIQNPYNEHVKNAVAALPRRVSVLAARLAELILITRCAERYAPIAYEYEGIVIPRWEL